MNILNFLNFELCFSSCFITPSEFNCTKCKDCIGLSFLNIKKCDKIKEKNGRKFISKNQVFDLEKNCEIEVYFEIEKVNLLDLKAPSQAIKEEKNVCEAFYVKFFDSETKIEHLLLIKKSFILDCDIVLKKDKRLYTIKHKEKDYYLCPFGSYSFLQENGKYPDLLFLKRINTKNPEEVEKENKIFWFVNTKSTFDEDSKSTDDEKQSKEKSEIINYKNISLLEGKLNGSGKKQYTYKEINDEEFREFSQLRRKEYVSLPLKGSFLENLRSDKKTINFKVKAEICCSLVSTTRLIFFEELLLYEPSSMLSDNNANKRKCSCAQNEENCKKYLKCDA